MLQKSGNNLIKLKSINSINIYISRDLVLAQLTKLHDEPNVGKFTNFSNRSNPTQGKSKALCLLPSCRHADEK